MIVLVLPASNEAARREWAATGALPVLAAVAYIAAPGHPDLPFRGIPLGVSGLAAIVVLVTIAWWARDERPSARSRSRIAFLLIALAVLKVAVDLAATQSGWLARYYANADFAPPIERSIDFPDADGTRVDRTIDFADTQFPVHFFNEWRFAHGFRREYTDAFSVHWTGHLRTDVATAPTIDLEARGAVRLDVDGITAVDLNSPAAIQRNQVSLRLNAGDHVIDVRYRKPPETEALLRVSGLADVTPAPLPAWRRTLRQPSRVTAWALHLVALGVIVWWLAPPVSRTARAAAAGLRRMPLEALDRVAAPAVIFGLVAQGCWKARHLIDRVWTLTAGDDWFEFESQARDIILNGPMLTQGAIVGKGQPYFYYPGYGYFVALAHRITGESIAGVIVVNFLLLALATILVYRLARALVGPAAALTALAWLLLIEQAAFTRYYTVTLLSENLFVFTAAAAVLGLTLHISDGRQRPLIWSAVAGGISALTRPSIMLFLPLAAGLIAVQAWRRAHAARGVALAALFIALWLAAVLPATIRNYIMSGDPVLISSGQAATFINYNLPSVNAQDYRDAFQGTLGSAAVILLRIFVDHPAEFLSNLGIKLGFILGMVHWMGGTRPHPELLLTSAGYLAAIALVPAARTLQALPLHAFVVTHLATLLLTMPSNYGYRLLLPMYLVMPVFAAAVPLRLFARRAR